MGRSGFRLKPVGGLLSARQFLNGLAFRVFHCTQFIRHERFPFWTPEPDLCHEYFGHIPMFADPAFAEFSQQVGIASLGASDEEIEALGRCYWFTVEFGVINTGSSKKIYGAGLLGCIDELDYAMETTIPIFKPFDVEEVVNTTYPFTEHQPLYFYVSSFEEAQEHCMKLASTMG
jgi:phenylalanine-4-hydroxylase